VKRDGQTVAIVQVARSSYFVNTTLTRLLLAVLILGAAGLTSSALAGFWLAGRTLRPIAVALQRQRDFTADASHEIRTPLALVRGNAELLTRHLDRPIGEYRDVVSDILDESDRLTRLVANLLTLARADDGRVQLDLTRVDLSALADTLLREFEPAARAKGLALRAVVQPGVAVWADADRLHELGVILLDNALRYTDAGQVTLTVRSEAHGAVLAVRDTGPGIAAEHLPAIFDRFYRVDAARSPERGCTGLGLAIARWIAEAHGGRIEVASQPGQGTTFTVHIPRPAPPDPSTEHGGQSAVGSRQS
jgi:signal transduction histidine kinase